MIRAGDRVSTVIARDASLIDVFVALSPAFERLRTPGVRKVMTRLVTVEQAARMSGVDLELLLSRLNAHLNETTHEDDVMKSTTAAPELADEHTSTATDQTAAVASSDATRPAALLAIGDDATVVIDVRDELRAGREPFSLIMAALRERPEHGALLVRATFEPVPLYAVMQRHQLTHWTERLADDDWKVWFYPEEAASQPAVQTQAQVGKPTEDPGDNVVVLDVRGLEPPEPMMQTLAALEQLPAGATLVQLNVRVPQFLLPLLEDRGFTYEIREQDEHFVRLFIRHKTT